MMKLNQVLGFSLVGFLCVIAPLSKQASADAPEIHCGLEQRTSKADDLQAVPSSEGHDYFGHVKLSFTSSNQALDYQIRSEFSETSGYQLSMQLSDLSGVSPRMASLQAPVIVKWTKVSDKQFAPSIRGGTFVLTLEPTANAVEYVLTCRVY